MPVARVPLPPSPFIGRARVLADLKAIVSDSLTRVVTVVGPPGVGKTRVAVEVAAGLADSFEGRVAFVPLAELRSASAVPAFMLRQLGGGDVGPRSVLEGLVETVGAERWLLVVDNFEHVAEAASLVAELVAACPALTMLVTSRRPLSIRAERCFRLDPLELPSPGLAGSAGEVLATDAVAFFVDRLRAANLGPRPIGPDVVSDLAVICGALDGLPLALELIAARTAAMSLGDLARDLDRRLELLVRGGEDLPLRQRTMRAAIAWSTDLLDERSAAVWRRLGVCVAGASTALVVGLGGDLGSQAELLDSLERLVQDSLVVRSERGGRARFGLLEVVREFALEKLEVSGDSDVVRRRHAASLLPLVEDAAAHGLEHDQAGWLDHLQCEEPNVTAAIRWAAGAGESDLALKLCLPMRALWYVRGSLTDGRALFDLALRDSNASSELRNRALVEASALARHHGDLLAATGLAREAVGMAESRDDQRLLASALLQCGFALHVDGQYDDARTILRHCRALSAAVEDQVGAALSDLHLGFVAQFHDGDLDLAAELQKRALGEFRQHGSDRQAATALTALADVTRAQGDFAASRALLIEAIERIERLSDIPLLIHCLHNAAALAADEGHLNRAVRLLGAADGLTSLTGAAPWPAIVATHQEWLLTARTRLGNPRLHALRNAGRLFSPSAAIALAVAVSDEDPDGLTAREREIATLVAKGMSNKAIADRLFLSPRTVDGHVARILTKLGFNTRAQIAAWFVSRVAAADDEQSASRNR